MQKRSPPRPTSDEDFASLSYRSREAGLSRILQRFGKRFIDSTLGDVIQMLERADVPGRDIRQILYQPADTLSLLRLVELADSVHPILRQKVMRNIMAKINSGKLDNRAVMKNLISLHTWAMVGDIDKAVTGYLVKVADDAFGRGTFLLQKRFGVAWEFDAYSRDFTRKFVSKRFTVKDAEDFIKPMGKRMEREMAEGIMRGESIDKVAKRVRDVDSNVSKVVSERVARTTITTVANDCHMDSYKKAGVKRYELVATYDERTCPVCGSLDGKRFPISEAVAGKNYPPIHPNCRCTTVAVLSKELEERVKEERIRNGGPAEYLSYETWYNTYGPGRNGEKFKPVR